MSIESPEQFERSLRQVDTTLLNLQAWKLRWTDRARSTDMAYAVLEQCRDRPDCQAKGVRRRNGMAMRTLAWQARWRGSLTEAEDLSHRALARLKETDADGAMADCLSILGVVYYSRGRRDLARDVVKRGFDLLSPGVDLPTRVDLLSTYATIERYGRRVHLSQNALDEAILISRDHEKAHVQLNMARGALHDGLPAEALQWAKDAEGECRVLNNRVVHPHAKELLATALIDLDRADEALEAIDKGLEIAREEKDQRAQCQLYFQLARAQRVQGDLDKAKQSLRIGHALAEEMGYPIWQKRLYQALADIQQEQGQKDATIESLRHVLALNEREKD